MPECELKFSNSKYREKKENKLTWFFINLVMLIISLISFVYYYTMVKVDGIDLMEEKTLLIIGVICFVNLVFIAISIISITPKNRQHTSYKKQDLFYSNDNLYA